MNVKFLEKSIIGLSLFLIFTNLFMSLVNISSDDTKLYNMTSRN